MKPAQPKKEIMVLGHDPVPGYKPVFLIIFLLSLLYILFILLQPAF